MKTDEVAKNSVDAETLAEGLDSQQGEEIRSDRRRLLIAGLIAAPFMLTLAARPASAWGGGGRGTVGCYDYGDDPHDPHDGWDDSDSDDDNNSNDPHGGHGGNGRRGGQVGRRNP